MRLRIVLTCLCAGLIGLLSGCGGGLLLEVKDREIRKLREENTAWQDSLKRSAGESAQLQRRVQTLTDERSEVDEQLAELHETVRGQKQELDRLSKEKVKLEGRLLQSDRSYEHLRNKLKDVQDVAAKTADEYADLRLKNRELEDRGKTLQRLNRTLREENTQFSTELFKVKDELKREQAVVRSMTQNSSGQIELSTELQNRVRDLENTKRELRAERISLIKELEAMKSRLPEGEAADLATTRKGIYHDDPLGIFQEFAGFAGPRYGRMLKGRATWDASDCGLAAAACGAAIVLLWVLWTPRRWKKRKAMRRELKRLRQFVKEAADRDPKAIRPKPTRQRQGGMVRRSGQFSPIISGDVHEDDVADDGSAHATGEAEAADEGHHGGRAARGSQVIGARQWVEDEEDDGEFAHTQVIPGGGEIHFQIGGSQGARDPLGSPQAAGGESGRDEENEFGSTQIIPSLEELHPMSPAGKAPAGDSRREEEESESPDALMDELEELIGKKVDELIQ